MKIIFLFLFLINILFSDGHDDDHHLYKKDLTFLALNPSQQIIVKKILQDYRIKMKSLKQTQKMLAQQKQTLFLQDKFDSIKMQRFNREWSDKASFAEIEFLERMHAILTFEQKKKFIHYMDEWEID
ncbi:MAG: hypothetical protein ACWGHH_04260 [Sulfurovaceae bacterium]